MEEVAIITAETPTGIYLLKFNFLKKYLNLPMASQP